MWWQFPEGLLGLLSPNTVVPFSPPGEPRSPLAGLRVWPGNGSMAGKGQMLKLGAHLGMGPDGQSRHSLGGRQESRASKLHANPLPGCPACFWADKPLSPHVRLIEWSRLSAIVGKDLIPQPRFLQGECKWTQSLQRSCSLSSHKGLQPSP